MPALKLISFDICPYVQRSAIALREKGVDYEIAYVDLANKPAWFLDISPHGKVPVLLVDGTPIFESLAILEYLDETVAPRLHPEDPLERAKDRAWFTVPDALNQALWKMMTAGDRDALAAGAQAVREGLRKLEPVVVGPLWRGERFCAMDAVACSALQRARWLDALYPELALFDGVPAVDAWERTLSTRPSVLASTVPDVRARVVAALPRYGAVHRGIAG